MCLFLQNTINNNDYKDITMSQDYPMNFTNNITQRYSDVDIFSTQGRIGQKRYFVYSIVIPFILFWAMTPIAGLASFMPVASNTLFYAGLGLAVLGMLLMTVRLTIQRCHDFNKSGALAIFAIIPFANIIFALIPGTNGLNQYGEVPKPATWLFKLFFYVVLALVLALAVYVVLNLANGSLIDSLLSL